MLQLAAQAAKLVFYARNEVTLGRVALKAIKNRFFVGNISLQAAYFALCIGSLLWRKCHVNYLSQVIPVAVADAVCATVAVALRGTPRKVE